MQRSVFACDETHKHTTAQRLCCMLARAGYIKEYVAIVDQRKVGLKFAVIVHVSLNSQRIEYVDEFLDRIADLNEVMEAYTTGGIFDVV